MPITQGFGVAAAIADYQKIVGDGAIGDVAVTLTIFGTTAGGATSSEGTATASLPYYLYNGKLYCVVIATGIFDPKTNGIFRITVGANKQF